MVKLSDIVQISTTIAPSVVGGHWYVKPASYDKMDASRDAYIAHRMGLLQGMIHDGLPVTPVTKAMLEDMLSQLDAYDKAYAPSIHRDYWRLVLWAWLTQYQHAAY